MMDQVYDLPANPPNPDLVDRMLQINGENLATIATILSSKADDSLDRNSIDLGKVEGKINRTITGRLNQNSGIAAPIVNALQGTVDAALGANAAILSDFPPTVQTIARNALAAPAPAPPNLPDEGPSSWYCVTGFGTPPAVVYWTQQRAAANSGLGGTVVTGPYTTQEEAQASCGPPVFTLPPGPEPPLVGPEPPLVGPEPPPVGPPVPTPPTDTGPAPEKWFCLGSTVGNESTVAKESETGLLTATGWKIVSGPWDDKATAEAKCAGISLVPSPIQAVMGLWPKWCRNDVCAGLDASKLPGVNIEGHYLEYMLGWVDDKGGVVADTFWEKIVAGDWKPAWFPNVVITAVQAVDSAISAVLGANAPAAGSIVQTYLVMALVDLAEKYLGLGLGDLKKTLGYTVNYYMPTEIPGIGEADEGYLSGIISRDQWKCWVQANNVCFEPHNTLMQGRWRVPGWREAELLYRTGQINQDRRLELYRRDHIKDPTDQHLFNELYTQWPGMGDIIRFMVRDVFDPAIVASAGLDLEFTDKWTEESKRLGKIAGVSDELARYYWMAHWQLPSISQTYEMMRRLRPGRVDAKMQFTKADALKLLSVNDMAPGYIDRLIEISYSPLPIRALRTLFDTDQISALEVGERYQDMGYSVTDAGLFIRQEVTLKARRIASQTRGWTPTVIAKAYEDGAIDGNKVLKELGDLGYSQHAATAMMERAQITRATRFALKAEARAVALTQASAIKAYKVGSIGLDDLSAVLNRLGWTDPSIGALSQALDLDSRTEVVSAGLSAVRKSLLRGEVAAPQALSQLLAVGIAPARAQDYVASWSLQLSPQRKGLSGNQVLKLVREGLLTREQAAQRLTNLGFPADDLQLMLAEISYQTEQSKIRSQVAFEKQRAKAATALMREIQRQTALTNNTRKELCKKTPVAVLGRWFVANMIDAEYFHDSLQCQGYSEDQINGFIAEARAKRSAKEEKQKAKEAKATAKPSGNGSGGTSIAEALGPSPAGS